MRCGANGAALDRHSMGVAAHLEYHPWHQSTITIGRVQKPRYRNYAMEEFFAVELDPDFPVTDLEIIIDRLVKSQGIVPGFSTRAGQALDLRALFYTRDIEGYKTVILPDRNIVSRIARIAENGVSLRPFDKPTQLAADTMALSQCMDCEIEPSIAFHELAHIEGNESAHRELSWFRAGDQLQALAWIDVAMGRSNSLRVTKVGRRSSEDLAKSLKRWRRNYVVALKIAELELQSAKPRERALALFDWMRDEFLVAGPAAAFATMYLSPITQRKRTLKHLRSTDRERAIKGIRNAAWDITHLSDFVRRVGEGEAQKQRYILATADAALASVAGRLFSDRDERGLSRTLTDAMAGWWPSEDARALGGVLAELINLAANRPPPGGPGGEEDPVSRWIKEGEEKIRSWAATG